MKNKVLVKLIIPEIDCSFDTFIPTNELIWKIKKLLVKAISDLTDQSLDIQKNYILLNQESGQIYQNNITVYETDIRNATELILLQEK